MNYGAWSESRCGEVVAGQPDNAVGYGLVDAFTAVEQALSE